MDNETPLRAQAGIQLAVIEQSNRKRLQIEVASRSRKQLQKLTRRFGGRINKLRKDWLKHTLGSQKTKPIKIGKHHLHIPASTVFGTGEHATTALCLRLLERVTQSWGARAPRTLAIAPSRSRTFLDKRLRRGAAIGTRGRVRSPDLVVDLGTGSGILALAAKRLGAKRAIGIDLDPIAISTAKENARLNKIDDVKFQIADARRWRFPRNIDIVTANLFSELLIAIIPKLKRVRRLILSGILRNQEAEIMRALKRIDIDVVELRRRGKWIALLGKR